MKITILYDNRCDNCHLQEGWGFSALIEDGKYKILFDTGGDTEAVSSNAEKLQIPFGDVTHLLFSHRHWDHIAGFKERIASLNHKTALYIPKTFPLLLKKHAASRLKTVRVVKEFESIEPNIYSLVLRGGWWLYEQALIIQTPQGLCVITGCAHPGILHILKEAKERLKAEIAFVLGGFHMLYDRAVKSEETVRQFQELGVQKVAPCHCSGDYTIRQFQNAYGPNYVKVGTGTVIHV